MSIVYTWRVLFILCYFHHFICTTTTSSSIGSGVKHTVSFFTMLMYSHSVSLLLFPPELR